MLKPAVSSAPYYARYEVHPTADKFMVLACDGLWDVISDQEAVRWCTPSSFAFAVRGRHAEYE